MVTVHVPDSLEPILQHVEGETLDEKLVYLVTHELQRRLQLCASRILEYETKYGLRFEEFRRAWEAGAIPDRYSHAVERHYMEWESLEDERSLWLAQLRALRSTVPARP